MDISKEHEIMACALEAEATFQEKGQYQNLGIAIDPTYESILEATSTIDTSISFAFTFWDNWVDAANHEWLYHEPIKKKDWPNHAREIAQAIRNAELPTNLKILEHNLIKPRVTFKHRLGSLFKGST